MIKSGASLSSLPHYAEINKMWGENVPVYGGNGQLRGNQWYGVLEPELYSTKQLNQANQQNYENTPYGSKPLPRMYEQPQQAQANPALEYAQYVDKQYLDPDVKAWLQGEYQNFYRDWAIAGMQSDFISFVESRLTEAMANYKPQRNQNTARYAPMAGNK